MAWTKVGYGDILRNGTRGNPVCDVQRFANESGIWNDAANSYIIRVDGMFGESTEWFVRYYQEWANPGALEIDGQVGPKTWSFMKKGLGGLQTPDSKGAKLIKAGCSDWD